MALDERQIYTSIPTGGKAREIDEVRRSMAAMRGRLFQEIEAWGLSTKREKAMKGVIRQSTYDLQANLEATFRGEDH